MVNQDILEKYGCTQARLREIFTAKKGKDHEIRERFQDQIQSRIHEGIQFGARNAKLYMAVDVGWDSLPINKSTIPLLQYAQGKISVEQCHDKLNDVGSASQFCDYDEEGNLKKIDTLRLYEVSVNLIRSYVTRRVAAQVSRFSNLYPYFKYDPRSTSLEDKLRADVLSQRVEIMTDQFGYRHQFEQIIRQMFMYGHSVAFPAEGWTEKVQWRNEINSTTGESDLTSYVEKEGVQLFTPHPTRLLYDRSKPLHDVNNDQGPEWIGYWDIIRYGDVKNSTNSWNIDEISYTNSLSTVYDTYADFFGYYFQTDDIIFPRVKDQYSFQNEIVANTGVYAAEDDDKGMFVTQMCMRVNPKTEGIGDYPHDVWVKFTVASDETVMFAEFLPSLPAIYGGINENDDRLVNISVAHEIMPFQDQLSNIMNKMLHDMKVSMFKIFAIDQDALDDEVKEYIRDALADDSFYAKPKALFYSGQKAADLGINNNNFIQVVDAQQELQGGINNSIQAILQLLNLVERLLILSPQELGQPAPREISATEVAEIANTTNSVYSYISEGIDDMRAAAKKLFYEHLVSRSTTTYKVPIKNRYTEEVIRSAGFDVDREGIPEPARRNIIGTPDSLIHEYLFSARDGAERSRDTQSAQVLGNLVSTVLQVDGIAEALGKERVFEMFNEIFRLSGAYDLRLETDEFDEQQEAQSIENEQFVEVMKKQFPMIIKTLQELGKAVSEMKGTPAELTQAGPEAMPRAEPAQQPITQPTQQLQQPQM